MSKLSSMHSFRKSFASSRLQELVHSDDLIDDNSSICDSSPYAQPFANQHNSRKRPLSLDSDSDVEEVLSQIYIPPTPCIISAIEEEDPSASLGSLECLSSPPGQIKKPRMSIDLDEIEVVTCSSLSPHHSPTDRRNEEIGVRDFEIDVDVVGEEERSVWSTDPSRTLATLNVETVDEVMDEFRLDFHLTSPSPSSSSDMENESKLLRGLDEVPKPSEESKENTCEPVSSTVLSAYCPPGLNVPLADLPVHQHKSPNSANTVVGNPENSNSPEKQFSSCGHSSIFGELQSVVFHSLIASLET